MGSSFVHDLSFEPDGYAIRPAAFSQASSFRIDRVLSAFAPKLIAMGGLALFGCALVIAFRIIELDAAHELRQPAIDFAICGAIAFLGLSISWLHLGDNPRADTEETAEETMDFAVEMTSSSVESAPDAATYSAPRSAPGAFSAPLRKQSRQNGVIAHGCPYCGQKMTSLGSALSRCRTCGHLENHGRVSFLDSSFCNCDNCSSLPYAAQA